MSLPAPVPQCLRPLPVQYGMRNRRWRPTDREGEVLTGKGRKQTDRDATSTALEPSCRISSTSTTADANNACLTEPLCSMDCCMTWLTLSITSKVRLGMLPSLVSALEGFVSRPLTKYQTITETSLCGPAFKGPIVAPDRYALNLCSTCGRARSLAQQDAISSAEEVIPTVSAAAAQRSIAAVSKVVSAPLFVSSAPAILSSAQLVPSSAMPTTNANSADSDTASSTNMVLPYTRLYAGRPFSSTFSLCT